MLHLVDAYWNHIRLIKEDIRGHEHGIGKEAGVDIVGMLGGFVFKLGHAAQLAHIGKAVQDPGQLGMGAAVRLIIYAVLFRVEAGCDIQDEQVPGPAAQLGRILPHRDGMHVHNAVEAFIFIA